MTKRLTLRVLPACLVGIFLFYGASLAHAGTVPPVTVDVYSADFLTKTSFDLASANNASGVSIAAADLGNDGIPEIVVGNGLGNEPRVHVLRTDGSEIGSFLAYSADMGVGVNVAVCDVNGDGENEIVTAPQRGGGPQIRVFSNMGDAIDAGGAFAYMDAFRGGVNLACGDLNGDGHAEIVTLPAAGGGPHVRVWDLTNGALTLTNEFFAFDGSDRRGLVGTIANGMLVVASSKGDPIDVRTYDLHSGVSLMSEQQWTDEATTTGATDVFVENNATYLVLEGSQHITNITSAMHETTTVDNWSPRVALADVDGDGTVERIVTQGHPLYAPATSDIAQTGKAIDIDISEQRLYAYEDGILTNTFFVSTAREPYQTPRGNHEVLAKLPYVYYAGTNLDGSTWDLGNVPWNLRIYPHIYIHYAYWHNNFGHPMSHGCINVNLENMKWIYNWSDVGVPVNVHY